jgi:Icc-related predicted phosphoesterase
MPIHLPPLSRRSFLQRALVAGAGLTCAPELFAAAMRRTDANSWALLADTHVDADPKKVNKAINMTDHLAAVSKEVLALPERAAGVFVVGDCAFSKGEPGDYTQFASLLEPMRAGGMPVHLALGNHDQRENFWAALEAKNTAKRPVADKQAALVRSEQVNWFMLDSLEKTLQTPGALGADQLKWLAATLDANADKPAIVLVHHNPGLDGNFGLKDTEALLEVMRPRKQAKAWIYGHTHNWKVSQDESGIHLVNLPPVAYVFSEGDPSGWVHATVSPGGMKLELRSLDRQHAARGQVVDLKWREA